MATWWSLLLFLPVSARGIVKRPGLKQSFFNLNWLAGKWKMLRFLWDLQGRSRRRFYVAGQKLLASGLGFLQISCTSIPAKRKELCFELHHANFGKQRNDGLQKVRFLLQKTSCNFGWHCGTTQGTGQSVGFWCPKMQRVRIGHWWWCFTGGLVPKLCENRWCGSSKLFWATHFGESSTTQIYTIWRLHTIRIFTFKNWDLKCLSSCLIRNTSGALTKEKGLKLLSQFVRLPVELGPVLFETRCTLFRAFSFCFPQDPCKKNSNHDKSLGQWLFLRVLCFLGGIGRRWP